MTWQTEVTAVRAKDRSDMSEAAVGQCRLGSRKANNMPVASLIRYPWRGALCISTRFIVSTELPSAVIELNGASMISWYAEPLRFIFAIVSGSAASLLKQRFGARVTFIGAATVFTLQNTAGGNSIINARAAFC